MKLALSPMKTTLIGGAMFLFPLIVMLYAVSQGLALVAGPSTKLAATLAVHQLGGLARASVTALWLLCCGAAVPACAAFARSLSASFEARLNTLYPHCTVIKAMAEGLHGARLPSGC